MTTTTDQVPQLLQLLNRDTFRTLLGLELQQAAGGRVLVTATPTAEHCNAGGLVHGGYLSALADFATGVAALSANDMTAMAPHASLTMQNIALARPGEILRCEATCTRTGRRAATAEATITAGDRLIAKALSTHTVVEPSG